MEEQQQFLLHRRKDSACSEVAAFLCISGRTSRISSVGSQGSANSKLSVLSGVSGISRSPSPHRMLLETSFCGPKPIPDITDGSMLSSIEPSTVKTLEQVILSRKRDPTEAVLAEGVNIDPLYAGRNTEEFSRESDIRRRKSDSNANTFPKEDIINPPQTSRSISNKRYIPPTDLSKPIVGLMPSGTEYIRIKLKPDHCYSDNGIADNERILEDDQKKPNTLNLDKRNTGKINYKQSYQTKSLRDNVSRSPSPSNTNFSRKSSFCSIFKLKDAASPDSPRVSHIRKKSGTNSMNEYSERSRSKSKERDPVSINTTPSKQKSVLDIFKPKKNISKSKSPSPIDSHPRCNTTSISNDEEINPNRPHLKYYEAPLDGKSIHIPLHTPPEEKQFKPALNELKSILNPQSIQPVSDEVSPSARSGKLKNNCTVIYHNRPKPMPPLKCYRIENPDGSITIPLKSPTEDKERVSIWSMEVQRNSSQDSQDTIISAAVSRNNTSIRKVPNASLPADAGNVEIHPKSAEKDSSHGMISSPKISEMSTKEKKQLLFSMKMGSGSQEQVFSTQFSISKTESQCSQLSEPATDTNIQLDTNKTEQTSSSSANVGNKKDVVKRRSLKEKIPTPDKSLDCYRHSRYIENPEEILSIQSQENSEGYKHECSARFDEEKGESRDKNHSTNQDPESRNALIIHNRKSILSNDERGISSESEKDSEIDSTFTNDRVHTSMMTVEDHESAGLVLQESFEDELPYIPTTLPEERAIGVKLIPMKERASMEMKTCPLERPRSTTPIYPSSLDNYCGIKQSNDDTDGVFSRNEKLRISLPKKHDAILERPPKNRSPRKSSLSSVKNWFEFAEQFNSNCGQTCSDNGVSTTKPLNTEGEPPPLPPRKMNTPKWIDFENIPEKRSQPKQVATVSQTVSTGDKNVTEGVLYSYVKPEECQCECHESERDGDKQSTYLQSDAEDIQPLLLQNLPEDSAKRR